MGQRARRDAIFTKRYVETRGAIYEVYIAINQLDGNVSSHYGILVYIDNSIIFRKCNYTK